MDANADRYCLTSIKKTLADGKRLPSPSEVSWLVEECERLSRANRALDREVARLDLELKQKDAEFSAAEMELLDVSEELSKCRQQLAVARQIEG
jgi:chromosome segregation ATPase